MWWVVSKPRDVQQTIVYLLLTAGYLASSSVAAWALFSLAAPATSRQHLITTTVTCSADIIYLHITYI